MGKGQKSSITIHNIDDLIQDQRALFEQIEEFYGSYKRSNKERLASIGYLKGRIESLDSLWARFASNDRDITKFATPEDRGESYFTELYEKTDQLYSECKGIILDTIAGLDCSPTTPPHIDGKQGSETISSADTQIQLPRIVIPKFSGDYDAWLSFHDLFKSMIHSNDNLPDVQKMHYLKSCLSGDAEQVIKHLYVTKDNYKLAWKLLCDRFQNKRALVNNILKKLMSLTHIHTESCTSIRKLLDSFKECLASLQNLHVEVSNWDPIAIYLLVERLPSETRQLWEQKQGESDELPTLPEIQTFLEGRFRTLEAISSSKVVKVVHKPSTPSNKMRSFHIAGSNCLLCSESHSLRQCPKFEKMNLPMRSEFVSTHSLCYNCLAKSHGVRNCTSKQNCRVCKKRHNTLLHPFSVNKSTSQGNNCSSSPNGNNTASTNQRLEPHASTINSYFVCNRKQVLLATALIRFVSPGEEVYLLRALVDPGSQATFITNHAVQRLRLKPQRTSVQVSGLGNKLTANAHSLVNLYIQPVSQNEPSLEISAIVLPTLTDLLPPKNVSTWEWSHIEGLKLADPHFDRPGRIDVILGAEVYCKIIQSGLIHGPPGTPTAQKTSLGWILLGEIFPQESVPSSRISSYNIVVNMCNQAQDCEQLRKFWEIEELIDAEPISTENDLCEKHFRETHSRDREGRFVVRLPFAPRHDDRPILGTSRDIALKRLKSLERRFHTDSQLKQTYNACLKEYLNLKHMEKTPYSQSQCESNYSSYLPHHAVFKGDSLTTKTRIVFDASCKTSNGYSLNDRLLTGPPLQRDIALLLFEWRQKKFAFTADIEKMYRQVNVHPDDQNFQRIVWRRNPTETPADYRLSTVTFGVSSAPFLAIRSLHQLAKDEEHEFPIGAGILKKDFYVDDVFSGGATLDEAIEARHQIDELLRRGKFELRKWASNSKQILESIPILQRRQEPAVLFNKDNVVKTLGIYWNPDKDLFCYHIQIKDDQLPLTKRRILSCIARIYDPLGWLSPVTITLKILIQKLWQQGLSWDELVNSEISHQFSQYLTLLPTLEKISVPRFLDTEPQSSLQLHAFCDASERAYAAVLYLRSEFEGVVNVHLIAAKTKVAPVKSMTLPRLELCGAVLLSKLIKKYQPSINSKELKTFAWTDSTIVLCWIRKHPNVFKTFVSNRISEIIQNVGAISWRHISSAENPADVASRGILPDKLEKFTNWWQGPSWLSSPESQWPLSVQSDHSDPAILEVRCRNFLNISEETSQLLHRFSSLKRLLRVTAYCFRFIAKCRKLSTTKGRLLEVTELDAAKQFWVRTDQQRCFADEIKSLSNGFQVKNTSRLKALNPFLDANGHLRVGGRLENAPIPYNEQHPLIMSPHSHLTKLFMRHAHEVTLHGGTTLMLSFLRKNLWIIDARNVVKGCIRKCIRCLRHAKQVQQQLMGDLPSVRVTPTRPFFNTGVDYAGPFSLRTSRHKASRTYKGYLAIFVCLFSKAIHIEVVSDLTTQAFLAAFRRFTSRRGLCRHVYSDCGSNFIGAQVKLHQDLHIAYKHANQEAADIFSAEGTQWHFIPPASPHFGGLWEAGVKSVKHHLRRTAGDTHLTFEEMSTLTAQIEACLNSRPLCPLNNDPNDLRVLTPGHFLIGDALLAPPEKDFIDTKLNSLDRWEFIQKLKQDFWKAWNREYLSRLQQRPKWRMAKDNVQVGDLVLVKDEKLPPSRWSLSRVIQTHPGSDGLVRVVTIRTQSGELKRPISKICLLPRNDPYQPSPHSPEIKESSLKC